MTPYRVKTSLNEFKNDSVYFLVIDLEAIVAIGPLYTTGSNCGISHIDFSIFIKGGSPVTISTPTEHLFHVSAHEINTVEQERQKLIQAWENLKK